MKGRPTGNDFFPGRMSEGANGATKSEGAPNNSAEGGP